MKLETLDQIHVQIQDPWSSDRRVSKRANLAGLRIHQNGLAIRGHDCLIGVAAVQSVYGRHRKAGIRYLREPVEIDHSVGHFRSLAHIFWKRSYNVRCAWGR